jgi:hypothetical protein
MGGEFGDWGGFLTQQQRHVGEKKWMDLRETSMGTVEGF